MVSLTIDGRRIVAEEGQTVLEAARPAGIEIPTLCYYRAVSPYGACRVCIVEIADEGNRRLTASCSYPVREGLEVQTASERVLEARRVLVGLILARAPEAERVRALAEQLGVEEPEVQEDEDCILCGQCVRVCGELMGVAAINFEGRGPKRRVTTPFGEHSDICIACGACAFVCPTGSRAVQLETILGKKPVPLLSEFEERMEVRPTVYTTFPQAVPNVPIIDKNNCVRLQTGKCGACAAFCEPDAILYDQKDSVEELEVGQILVATGHQLFDPARLTQYGYGRLDNVFTSLEFERMLNSTGPTGGKVLCKNGQPPRAVGIVHCVGSRDENYNRYCSRVCCMYALKFAHLVAERTDAQVYQFYIDMRTFGKGYEEFYSRVLHEGSTVIRGKVAEVVPARNDRATGENGHLLLRCEDTLVGKFREIPVDMVVLCNALEPRDDIAEASNLFTLSRSPDGFFLERHPKLDPVGTMNDGVYIAGTCQGPKDIPDTVAQAQAAAARILGLIAKGEVLIDPIRAEIDADSCSGCRMCNALCPYQAITFDQEQGVSEVNQALCKGCGTCVAACPAGAIAGSGFSDEQILAELEAVLV